MSKERRCRGVKADGTPCRARSSLVNEESGYCFAHDPAQKQKLSEAGRSGARALHKRYSSKALSDDELPDLAVPQDAARRLDLIAQAVGTGRLGHNEGRTMVGAVQQWLRAYDAVLVESELATLRDQIRELKHDRLKAV